MYRQPVMLTPSPDKASGTASSRLDATWPSITAVPSVAGHRSQARDLSLPTRCPGRSNHAVAAPVRHSGTATRSTRNKSVLSSTDTPSGSSPVPPNPQ